MIEKWRVGDEKELNQCEWAMITTNRKLQSARVFLSRTRVSWLAAHFRGRCSNSLQMQHDLVSCLPNRLPVKRLGRLVTQQLSCLVIILTPAPLLEVSGLGLFCIFELHSLDEVIETILITLTALAAVVVSLERLLMMYINCRIGPQNHLLALVLATLEDELVLYLRRHLLQVRR